MTKVYCVFVKNETYTKEWVYKLRDGLKVNTTEPFEFFCLTNEQLPGINTIGLNHPNGWWSKMELCRPDIQGIVHYMDLDCVVTGNMDFFLREKESLLYRDWLHTSQKESSMFVLDDEKREKVWNFWKSDRESCMFNFFGDGRIYNFCIGKEVRSLQEKHPGKIMDWKTGNEKLGFNTKVINFSGKPKQNDFHETHWLRTFYW